MEDYPSVSYQKGICMILLKFGNKCTEKFLNLLELGQSIGIDAQFVNNSLRRPLYIICTQDPDTFKTIPGFVCFLAHNNQSHLNLMMEQFVKYLKLVACKVPKYVMIDKCHRACSRGALWDESNTM